MRTKRRGNETRGYWLCFLLAIGTVLYSTPCVFVGQGEKKPLLDDPSFVRVLSIMRFVRLFPVLCFTIPGIIVFFCARFYALGCLCSEGGFKKGAFYFILRSTFNKVVVPATDRKALLSCDVVNSFGKVSVVIRIYGTILLGCQEEHYRNVRLP